MSVSTTTTTTTTTTTRPPPPTTLKQHAYQFVPLGFDLCHESFGPVASQGRCQIHHRRGAIQRRGQARTVPVKARVVKGMPSKMKTRVKTCVHTMATQWQHNGNTTTIRSGQQKNKQRMSTDSKVLSLLEGVPKALERAVEKSPPQHVHVGDHHCVVRDVTAIAVVQHGNAWHGGNVVLQRTKKKSSGNRC